MFEPEASLTNLTYEFGYTDQGDGEMGRGRDGGTGGRGDGGT